MRDPQTADIPHCRHGASIGFEGAEGCDECEAEELDEPVADYPHEDGCF